MMKSISLLLLLLLVAFGGQSPAIPDKTVVLTFDDAVKSHRTVTAPLLKELDFQATFFITQNWMKDAANFLSWEDVAEIHHMGFEIGNHSWTHADFGKVENGARLGEELEQVEQALARVGVPKPISFAWCGNSFGPEAIRQLRGYGYKLARRGMQPEIPYGKIEIGPALDVAKYHPLLIPTTGDAYPDWTFEHFKKVVAQAKAGKAVVLQFHGTPDLAHPWVHTPPEALRQYMRYLKENGYRAIAMRDLLPYFDQARLPEDPMLELRLSPSFRPNGPKPESVVLKTADGGVVYGDLYGTGGRGVVLAHGGRFLKESWWKQAQILAGAGYRVLAIDFRGYGRSTGPGGDVYTAPLYQDVLAAVRHLRKTGAKTVSIIGGSFGGGAAGEAMVHAAPGEIDRVAMIGSYGSETPEKMKGRKLFIVAREDRGSGDILRLPKIRESFELTPEPKKLVILEGSAHAQFLFGTNQEERLMSELLGFLSAP